MAPKKSNKKATGKVAKPAQFKTRKLFPAADMRVDDDATVHSATGNFPPGIIGACHFARTWIAGHGTQVLFRPPDWPADYKQFLGMEFYAVGLWGQRQTSYIGDVEKFVTHFAVLSPSDPCCCLFLRAASCRTRVYAYVELSPVSSVN